MNALARLSCGEPQPGFHTASPCHARHIQTACGPGAPTQKASCSEDEDLRSRGPCSDSICSRGLLSRRVSCSEGLRSRACPALRSSHTECVHPRASCSDGLRSRASCPEGLLFRGPPVQKASVQRASGPGSPVQIDLFKGLLVQGLLFK